MKESKVDFCVRDLEGALVVATEAGIAACIRDLARAVAREEIERERGARVSLLKTVTGHVTSSILPGAQQEPAKARQEPAKTRAGVRVVSLRSGEPVTAPRLRVEVDREEWNDALRMRDHGGYTDGEIARRLGLTLTDGDSDV